MALNPEQIKELKSQLSEQIQNLPSDKKSEAQKQINELSSEALEAMVEQQKTQQQIFRLILEGKIPSKKISENSDCLAVLEIKPISKGHIIIIPKKPCTSESQIPKSCFQLAEQISNTLIKNLNATSAKIQSQSSFGETIINIIPIYNSPLTLDSPRQESTNSELEELQNIILPLEEPIKKNTLELKAKKKEIFKLKRRIP